MPLPPQQLLVMAASLSMAAVVVSVMIAAGEGEGLPRIYPGLGTRLDRAV